MAKLQVGDLAFVLVPVLVCGVDVGDASPSDERDALVARALGHKHHRRLVRFDGVIPSTAKQKSSG